MPDRNYIYHSIQRGARRVFYKVECIPAHEDALASPTRIAFADGAVTVKGGEIGYPDDHPSGMYESKGWSVAVRYNLLTADQRTEIAEFTQANAGKVQPYNQTFDLTNIWRVYSNRGLDDGTDPDSVYWLLVYEGVQWIEPSPSIEILIGRGATVTYELRESVEWICGLARMQWICNLLYTAWIPVPTDFSTRYSEVVSEAFTPAGESATVVFQDVTEPEDLDFRLYPHSRFMLAAQSVCDDIYQQHLRTGENWVDDGFLWIWRSSNADLTDHATDAATPWDFFGYHEIDEDTDGDPGALIAREDTAFMGIIFKEGGSIVRAGLLTIGDESSSLQSFETLAEFLKSAVEFGACRVSVDHATAPVVQIWFSPAVLTDGARPSVDLDEDDLLVDASAKLTGKLAVGQILGQQWGARDARGEDQKQWRSGDGQSFGGRLLWDTNPIAGEAGWWEIKDCVAVPAANGRAFAIVGYWPWKVYHLRTVFGGSLVPCRVHHQVTYPVGRPSAALYGSNSPHTPWTGLGTVPQIIAGIRDVNLANQAQGGIQSAIIGAYNAFGDDASTMLPVRTMHPLAGHNDFTLDHVGSEITLPVDDAAAHTINALVEPGADYLTGHTTAVVVRSQIDLEKSQVAMSLFGRED